jgi:redox-sensitive bicupin YhaK (pirin superfamily)
MTSLPMNTLLPMVPFSHGEDFKGFGLRDQSLQRALDPFLSVDHFWMRQPTFAPHPHAGFSAVTYLFDDSQTAFVNRDSLGNQVEIAPGDLHWTRAASGLMHEEVPRQPGLAAHGLQIFVNLASSEKNSTPQVHRLARAEMPRLDWPGGHGQLVFGRYGDQASPLIPESHATMLDITIASNATIEIAIPQQRNVFLMVVSGAVVAGDNAGDNAQALTTTLGGAVATTTEEATLTVRGGSQDSQIVVFMGEPLAEPVVWAGPFVMNTNAEVIEAKRRFASGAMGTMDNIRSLQPLPSPPTRA